MDFEQKLPITSFVAPANENEKKHTLTILKKTRQILQKAGAKLRSVIVDSQYSDEKVGKAVTEAVIPYPSNQKRDAKDILRVDKKFRTHGPEDLKRKYNKRSAVETVFSFLKTCTASSQTRSEE